MGGALALYTATKNPKVGACVVFYGGHPKVKPDLPNLNAPVLGLYAEKDGFVTPELARDLERQLKDLGKQIEVKIYQGADHAFFNDTRPKSTTLRPPRMRGNEQLNSCASIYPCNPC